MVPQRAIAVAVAVTASIVLVHASSHANPRPPVLPRASHHDVGHLNVGDDGGHHDGGHHNVGDDAAHHDGGHHNVGDDAGFHSVGLHDANPRPVPPPSRPVSAHQLYLHADTSFGEHERSLLRNAARRLEAEVHGVLHLDITFDLDFNDLRALKKLARQALLLRAPRLTQAAARLDLMNGGETLGYTSVRPIRVYLVADRLCSDRLFEHVAMHEFLHAFGVGHVDDPKALMHRVLPRMPPLTLGRADRAALIRALLIL